MLKVIDRIDPEYLSYISKSLLDDEGYPLPVSVDILRRFQPDAIKYWMNERDIWTYPTIELLNYLHSRIITITNLDYDKVLEVAAGKGYLCKQLGIRGTDHYGNTIPAYMASLLFKWGRMAVDPLPHVERLSALDAVRKYKPQLVIASWLTHYSTSGPGSAWGCDEDRLLKILGEWGGTYIHIGNYNTHRAKPILRYNHYEIKFKGLFTRAIDPTQDCILEWRTPIL